jgi:hypothetical protein
MTEGSGDNHHEYDGEPIQGMPQELPIYDVHLSRLSTPEILTLKNGPELGSVRGMLFRPVGLTPSQEGEGNPHHDRDGNPVGEIPA